MSDLKKPPVFALVGDGYIKINDKTKQLEIYNDKESARKASGYVVDELSIIEVGVEKYGEMAKLQSKLTAKEDSLAKANDQIERMMERDRWIPVSEGLPENGVYVLAWLISKYCVLVRHSISADGWYSPEMGWYGKETITHWKPITPPTDKGENA